MQQGVRTGYERLILQIDVGFVDSAVTLLPLSPNTNGRNPALTA